MMPDYAIVIEELRRLARQVIPISLIIYGVLVLFGQPPLSTAIGVAAGTAFALGNFYMMGKSAMRATLMRDPGRAIKLVKRSYVRRYLFTALFLFAVIWTDKISVTATVLPLFAPKIALMVSKYKRKEENHK